MTAQPDAEKRLAEIQSIADKDIDTSDIPEAEGGGWPTHRRGTARFAGSGGPLLCSITIRGACGNQAATGVKPDFGPKWQPHGTR